MTSGQRKVLVPQDGESGLVWAIAASAVVHGMLIGAMLLGSQRSGGRTGPVSYTVDLVGAVDVGGTNEVSGGKRKGEPPRAPEKSAPQNAPAIPPPPPPVAPPAPMPAQPPPAPAPQAAVEPPQQVLPPAPEVVPPKAPEKVPPKPAEVIPAVKPKPEPEKPPVAAKPPKVEKPPEAAKPVEPQPQEKPKPETESKVAKIDEKPRPSVAARTAARAASPAATPGKKSATVKPSPDTKVASGAGELDDQIAAAVKRRANEQRIADAVAGRARALQQGGGADAGRGGGPLSVGPGVGSGGVLEAVEVVRYLTEVEKRIRANWVWAGTDQSLEVTVHFDLGDAGEVHNVRTVRSSGNPPYDLSAERAVKAASPLPPPPEKYRERFVDGVDLTFRPEDLQS